MPLPRNVSAQVRNLSFYTTPAGRRFLMAETVLRRNVEGLTNRRRYGIASSSRPLLKLVMSSNVWSL